MENKSLWQTINRTHEQKFPSLTEEIEVDVAIIGGGITGLTAATYLVAAGKKVAVIEGSTIGGGTTGNSTGNLYVETQPYFHSIVKKFSLEIAKAVAFSRKKAIDEIEHLVNSKNIDCHFSRRPWFLFTNDEKELDLVNKEFAVFKKMDMDIAQVKDLPLPFHFKKCFTLSNQARFNPLQYVQGLADDLKKQNCLIFENTRVCEFSEQENKKCVIKTPKGKVLAKKIIQATHTPIAINHLQMQTAPYRSYVIATRLKDQDCPEGHFWGVGSNQAISSTHAVDADHPELLLVAGRHHKTGQGPDTNIHFKELELYLKKQIPNYEIVHRWSAQHYQTGDDLPYIGLADHKTKNVYVATGFFADGLIYGTIAAKVLSDMVLGTNNKLTQVYDSNRSKSQGFGFIFKENANVFLEYLKDLPWTGLKHYQDVKKGEGKIVEIDGEKCAVSRDDNNKLHIVSGVCTHMKCIVSWNDTEQTWDCPCHGSRFSPDGEVLEGPATFELEKKKPKGD